MRTTRSVADRPVPASRDAPRAARHEWKADIRKSERCQRRSWYERPGLPLYSPAVRLHREGDGALPVAMSVGAGTLVALPLSSRQHEEFFLTAAQSLFGISLLLGLRLRLSGAIALAVLFGGQLVLAFSLQHNPEAEVAALTALGWFYLALSVIVVTAERRRLVAMFITFTTRAAT